MTLPGAHPFTYIIGNNGSGKSRALESDAQLKSKSSPVVVISSSVSDKFTYGGTVKTRANGSYTYAGNRTVGNGLHTNTLAANVVLNYARLINQRGEAEFLKFLPKMGLEPSVGIEYVKKKRSKGSVPFLKSELTSSFIQEFQSVFSDKTKPFVPIFKKGDKEYDFPSLSSGEQSMLATALRVLTNLAPRTIFYIDEPEISLHVEWQVKWPGMIQELVSKTQDVQVYVATHSPVIISSAMNLGMHCYSLKDDVYSEILEHDLNVERLIFNDFHTLTPDNKHIYNEFSRIISTIMDGINSGRAGVKLNARAEVKILKQKVEKAAAIAPARAQLSQTMSDFERAVTEILSSVRGGTNA
ncbi:AAA family ATPase [Massilia sp. 9096]|uniref:AAA family ATPase n=1 Tax=Massilia sp. 9096 TaxID=1500894 RepID=UPI0009DD6522|nr:AAA family ATPase [Massilia sp. 9096]